MKIAIAGYGVEGESNYHYWNTPGNELTVVDEREQPTHGLPTDVKQTILGPGAFEKLEVFDMVIRTAGLPPRKIKTDGKMWSSTNEFFVKCPAPIIGVTGSKGKGTTASLIASILEVAGKKVWLAGNIGIAGLDVLAQIQPEDIVVYELSSFQLWDVQKSPSTAVVLYIEPEHLDVHANLEEYIAAKSNIARFQGESDILVYNQQNDYATGISKLSAAQKRPYQNEMYAHCVDDWLWYGEQKLCSVDILQIPGRHNIDNACAAINAIWQYTQNTEVISQGLGAFTGLPHRLKLVGEQSGVRYYDDSIATTPGSAIAALAAFSEPKILILGGSSKGANFTELAHKIVDSRTKSVIIIGTEADQIEHSLTEVGYTSVHNLGLDTTMDKVVGLSRDIAEPGDIVILSPSCASFDMFKDYVDRGNQFISAVNQLDK